MSMLRKRSAQHKIHLPFDARENQYLLAKFRLTDELIAKYRKKLDEHIDSARRCKKVSALKTDIELGFNLQDIRFTGANTPTT